MDTVEEIRATRQAWLRSRDPAEPLSDEEGMRWVRSIEAETEAIRAQWLVERAELEAQIAAAQAERTLLQRCSAPYTRSTAPSPCAINTKQPEKPD